MEEEFAACRLFFHLCNPAEAINVPCGGAEPRRYEGTEPCLYGGAEPRFYGGAEPCLYILGVWSFGQSAQLMPQPLQLPQPVPFRLPRTIEARAAITAPAIISSNAIL